MAVHRLAEMTWSEVRDLDRERLVAILPVGAVEAHGPHLPISTDRIIAVAMAVEGARRLAAGALEVLLLPPVDYTAAGFAAGFPGTLSVRRSTAAAVLVDVARGLGSHGIRWLAVANAHLDPEHLGAIYDARDEIRRAGGPAIAFPDLTRKPWAVRLGDEFRSGACHAGRYEGSIVLARRPELVRDEVRRGLPANPASLSRAIRRGHRSFEEAGGPRAYFGDPAAATAAEGEERIAALGRILEEAVLEVMGR